MNQNLCILILMFLLLTEASFALDFYYQNCSVPVSCGRQNISYPFYIQGRHESFCGYPGFQLSCHGDGEDAYPLLQLSGNNYTIHNIDYQRKSLLVSNSLLSGYLESTACNDDISSLHNLTLPNDQFELASNQADFFLLYNCNSSVVESFPKYKVGCFDQPTNKTRSDTSVLALPRDEYPNFGSDKCRGEVVVAHARGGYENGEVGLIQEVLSRGFELNWFASDCSRCQDSGGRCGFNYTTYHFRCLCPRRTHSVRCRDAEGNNLKRFKIGLVAAVAAIVALGAIFCCLFWNNRRKNRQIVEAFLRSYEALQVRRYRYLDVKKMTNSFKEKLGQGGYGSVYKGKLNNGCLVAVKVLNKLKGNGEEFMNEVAATSRTSHVNIVSLLGYCFEGSKRALIYEFMPNGSLEKLIFDADTPKGDHDHHLGWEALDEISLGIARGLEYLHRGCNTRILHFDIKPHNILLDENFTPKISDFGLAKICNRKESIVSMLGARGTAGYIAPEVFCRNFGGVSHKSDVYSYGMMLSVMVGGRRNINAEAEDTSEIYFPHWIYKRLELDEELGLPSIINEEDKERARKLIIVSLWYHRSLNLSSPPKSAVGSSTATLVSTQ
ncbi:hypothetical protein L3X38_006047 [Prunus dulcis]|uniref:non-specific serine/threonine protein kinase n=1 Tax=Prunus dulcis TaxID=3755 RepID=A0AAD4ZS18_PRUDU|nr:hypothetical protein L3X38_006047 [Prunus dulcis]